MAVIDFACPKCGTGFRVSSKLAGKSAKCKKCGHHLQIPAPPAPVAAQAATGMFRLGDHQQGPRSDTPRTGSRPPRPAASEELRLAAISAEYRSPVAEQYEDEWDDENKISYDVSPPTEVLSPVLIAKKKRSSSFWPSWVYGKQLEAVMGIVRKISDLAYLISVPLLLLVVLGIVLENRTIAILSAIGVVLVNIGRLAFNGFYLAILAFKDGPLHGILFFIPPITFYYLAKGGKKLREATLRFLSPALPIIGILVLLLAVPRFRGQEIDTSKPVGERIEEGMTKLEEAARDELQQAGQAIQE